MAPPINPHVTETEKPTTFLYSWKAALTVAVLIALACVYTAREADVYFDDVYITLTYAKNLAAGEGMVFNPGERVQGTTTPLWTWLNAALIASGLPAPAACEILFVIFTWAAGFALFRIARSLGQPEIGALAGVLFPLWPDHVWVFGAETSLCIWLALETFLWIERRAWVAGLACGLLLLTRLDGGIVLIVGIAMLLARKQFRNAGIFFASASAIIVPWLIVAWTYYGTPLPNTLAAKQSQLARSDQLTWIQSMPAGTYAALKNWAYWNRFVAALALLGFARSLINIKRLWPLFSWPALHLIALTILGVAFYQWYLYPLWAALPFLAGYGASLIYKLHAPEISKNGRDIVSRWELKPELARNLAMLALSLFALLMAARPWRGDPVAIQRARFEGYIAVADYLREHADPGDSVLASEIGVLGYTSPIRVIDLAGLVHRDPSPDRIYNREAIVEHQTPEFILESWPNNNEFADLRAQAREGRYQMRFLRADGGFNIYDQAFHHENAYGMRVLLRRAS